MSGSGLGADGAEPQLGCRLRLVMGVTHPRETRHGGFLCWVPLDGHRTTGHWGCPWTCTGAGTEGEGARRRRRASYDVVSD